MLNIVRILRMFIVLPLWFVFCFVFFSFFFFLIIYLPNNSFSQVPKRTTLQYEFSGGGFTDGEVEVGEKARFKVRVFQGHSVDLVEECGER